MRVFERHVPWMTPRKLASSAGPTARYAVGLPNRFHVNSPDSANESVNVPNTQAATMSPPRPFASAYLTARVNEGRWDIASDVANRTAWCTLIPALIASVVNW